MTVKASNLFQITATFLLTLSIGLNIKFYCISSRGSLIQSLCNLFLQVLKFTLFVERVIILGPTSLFARYFYSESNSLNVPFLLYQEDIY